MMSVLVIRNEYHETDDNDVARVEIVGQVDDFGKCTPISCPVKICVLFSPVRRS